MFQFTTLYYRVDDEDKIEDFFANTHRRLAEQLPGLAKIEVSRVTGQPRGQSRFHLVYSLYFASERSFQLSLSSPAGFELIQALKPWYDAKLIVWYYADTFDEVVDRAQRGEKDDGLLGDV